MNVIILFLVSLSAFPLALAIVNGNVTFQKNHSFVGGLVYVDDSNILSLICGNAIITSQHVLTSAFCCNYCATRSIGKCQVLVGAFDTLDTSEENAVLLDVLRYDVHPAFKATGNPSKNACAIKLVKPMIYNDDVRPLCLPNPQNVNGLSDCNTYGWGEVDCPTPGAHFPDPAAWIQRFVERGKNQILTTHPRILSPSGKLRTIPVRKIPNAKCEFQYFFAQGVGCGISPPGTGPFIGDSGAPIVCKNDDGDLFTLGVFTEGPCKPHGTPASYTDYVEIYEWLVDRIGQSEIEKPCNSKVSASR